MLDVGYCFVQAAYGCRHRAGADGSMDQFGWVESGGPLWLRTAGPSWVKPLGHCWARTDGGALRAERPHRQPLSRLQERGVRDVCREAIESVVEGDEDDAGGTGEMFDPALRCQGLGTTVDAGVGVRQSKVRSVWIERISRRRWRTIWCGCRAGSGTGTWVSLGVGFRYLGAEKYQNDG